MINTNVVNYEFRYITASRQYPFSEKATYTDISGRTIPYSSFIDGIVYPTEYTQTVYLSKLFVYGDNRLAAEFSNETGVLGYIYNMKDGSNFIIVGEFRYHDDDLDDFIHPQDSVMGVLVANNTEYLRGLAIIAPMSFTIDTMTVDASRLSPIPDIIDTLTVNGTSIPLNKDVVFNFSSAKERFILTQEGIPFIEYVNYIVNKNKAPLVKAIVPGANVQQYSTAEPDVNAAFIYAPHIANGTDKDILYNDLRITVKDSALYFFKVGDDK